MRIVVIGAGGHSKEVADLVVACGHELVGFQDDAAAGPHGPTGLPVAADLAEFTLDAITIGIGSPEARRRLFERMAPSSDVVTLVHTSACVSPYAALGSGVQVMQNVVVSADARVGENVILNVGCFVAHDCRVGPHCHVAPGVLLSGGSAVGEASEVGAGAIVLPGVSVGAGCTVGAGAVVTRDVADGLTVAGVPARVLSGDSHAQ